MKQFTVVPFDKIDSIKTKLGSWGVNPENDELRHGP
jgi:hypothetical protein